MTKEELEKVDKFIYKSGAQRIVFSALLGTIRELIPFWMSEATQKDKEILKHGQMALNRMFKQFDNNGLCDDAVYEQLISDYAELSTKMLDGLLNIMLQKDGDEQEATVGVPHTDSVSSEQA